MNFWMRLCKNAESKKNPWNWSCSDDRIHVDNYLGFNRPATEIFGLFFFIWTLFCFPFEKTINSEVAPFLLQWIKTDAIILISSMKFEKTCQKSWRLRAFIWITIEAKIPEIKIKYWLIHFEFFCHFKIYKRLLEAFLGF